MNDAPELLSPEERRARQALLDLPRPRASVSFRARLKRDFVSGAIAAPARLAPTPMRPARGWMTLAPIAAALVLSGVLLNRGPQWTVASTSGSGIAVVDGQPILLTHREALGRALKHGGTVRLSAGTALVLLAPGQMAIEIAAGSEATVPTAAGRWLGRRILATVRSGEIRITTGRAFKGARLAVSTPEASLEVTGTTLAVIRESVGTCVCVMEGRVMMGPRDSPMAPIESGRRRFVFNDGRPAEEAEMRPVEKTALGEMRSRLAARLR